MDMVQKKENLGMFLIKREKIKKAVVVVAPNYKSKYESLGDNFI
jgi:hypothetical protein